MLKVLAALIVDLSLVPSTHLGSSQPMSQAIATMLIYRTYKNI